MRRVRVFFLGGTISMTGAAASAASAASVGAGLEPDLAGADLLESLPMPGDVVVDPVDVARVDSSSLTLDMCLDVLRRADDAVRRGEADGVVVVQGTDTLEETAYVWDLLWRHQHPFVVTGAMRAPDQPGADGPANLVASVSVATSEEGRDEGVLVVIGDEIHAARYVAKRHSSGLVAFASPDLGPLGRVQEGAPVMTARVPRRDVLPVPVRDARVALVRAGLDDDPALYRAAADLSDGLVVEGFGAGQVRPPVADVLGDVARERPVVLASRTGAGQVSTRTYAGRGSGADLWQRGVVPAGRLGGLRSRMLLRLLLGGEPTPGREDLVSAFRRHGT
jgi:L-asparaginase